MKKMSREAFILGQRREELNMTQKQIAAEIGISLQQYQRFEYGYRDVSAASAKLVLRICAALELDPYELIFENGIDLAGKDTQE